MGVYTTSTAFAQATINGDFDFCPQGPIDTVITYCVWHPAGQDQGVAGDTATSGDMYQTNSGRIRPRQSLSSKQAGVVIAGDSNSAFYQPIEGGMGDTIKWVYSVQLCDSCNIGMNTIGVSVRTNSTYTKYIQPMPIISKQWATFSGYEILTDNLEGIEIGSIGAASMTQSTTGNVDSAIYYIQDVCFRINGAICSDTVLTSISEPVLHDEVIGRFDIRGVAVGSDYRGITILRYESGKSTKEIRL